MTTSNKTLVLSLSVIAILSGYFIASTVKSGSSSTDQSDITLEAVPVSVKTTTTGVTGTNGTGGGSSIMGSVLSGANDSSGKRTIKGIESNSKSLRTVILLGAVDMQSVTYVRKQIESLDKTSGDIYLLISSPGGSIFAGDSLISTMQSSKNKVHTVCMDFCASMAAIIHQHGAKRYAYDRATLMFHDASGGFEGKFDGMRRLMDYIQRRLDKTNAYIVSRSKVSYQEFMANVARDLWIDAEDAERVGLVDGIVKVIPLEDTTPIKTETELKAGKPGNGIGPFQALPLTYGLTVNE